MITELWYAAGLAERPIEKRTVTVKEKVYVEVEKKQNVIRDFQYDIPFKLSRKLYFGSI